MKIAITGHSKGIGKSLYDRLCSKGHEVIGFSRSNGYDINTSEGFNKVFEDGIECDMFINNAYSGSAQLHLFCNFYNVWMRKKNKTIVNISSMAKYPAVSGNLSGYSAHKAALNHQHNMVMADANRKCKIITVNPGYVETNMTPKHAPKELILTVEECTDMIMWAIESPKHIEISELSFWQQRT